MTLARDLPCVLMAVDPGKTSGWCYLAPGFSVRHPERDETIDIPWVRRVGIATTWRERGLAVADAMSCANGRGWPLVVVAETWRNTRPKKGRPFPLPTAIGLGAQWGLWLAELQRLDVPERRIVRVDTGTWGKAVLGRSHMTTEQRHAGSKMRARVALGHDVGPDEAAALCLGLWGLRSEKVAKAIGRKELKRLGWSEEGS